MQKVFEHLSTRLWQRWVDKVGRISFFSNPYSVGRAYAGKTVTIRLDGHNHVWLMESEQGKTLKRYACQELCPERIFSFSLGKRSNKVSRDPG